MKQRTARVLVAGIVLGTFAPAAYGPSAQSTPLVEPALARAWVARVTTTNQELAQFVQVAEVVAEGGSAPWATGAPIAVGGTAPVRAFASPEHPSSVETPWTWNDSTGSAAVEMASTEAHTTGASARARTAATTVSGSGFSVVDMLLTWELQEELMGEWNAANSQIIGVLNDQIDTLEPALSPLGLVLPRLEPMAGLGWIDVINAQEVSADADASSSEYFSSARARAYASGVKLFGGFIRAYGVRADAVSESAGGVDERTAVSSIEHLEIAGIRVEASSEGITVADNDLTKLVGIDQTDLDGMLSLLADAGVTIGVGQSTTDGAKQQATALEIRLVTASGTILVSLGYAEAEAPSLQGPSIDPASPSTPAPTAPSATSAPTTTTTETTGTSRGAIEESPLLVAPPSSRVDDAASNEVAGSVDPVLTGPVARTLPQSVVRAVRTSYLVMLTAAVLAALTLPLVAGSPGWRRSDPNLVRRIAERTES